jgi:hypothetical protein
VTVEFVDPPSDPPAVEVLDVRRRAPRRHVVTIALVVAAVAVLIGAGLAVRTHHDGPRHRPVAARTTSHPPPTTAVHAAPITTHTSCAASMPPAWKTAIAAATTSFGNRQVRVVGVTDDGTLIGTFYPRTARPGRIALSVGSISLERSSTHTLGTFVMRGNSLSSDVEVEGTTVLITLQSGSQPTGPAEIVTIDTRSGAKRVAARLGGSGQLFDGAYLFRGAVYWASHRSRPNPRSYVHEYDPATGADPIVYEGATGESRGLQNSAAGVWWAGSSVVPDRPAGLPGPVLGTATDDTALASLVTDGTAYAWDANGAIDWWSPGERTVRIRLRKAVLQEVAGPLVFYYSENSSTLHAIDTRTGARVSIPNGIPAFAAHGVVYLENDPHMITENTQFTVTRLDTSALAPLSC